MKKLYVVRDKITGEFVKDNLGRVVASEHIISAPASSRSREEIVTLRIEPTEPCERCGVDDFAKNEGIVQLGFLSNKKVIFAVGDDDYVEEPVFFCPWCGRSFK